MAGVPEPLKRWAQERDVLRSYEAGDIIVSPCKWDDKILYIVSGRASVFLMDTEGHKVAVDTLGPGDIFGEVSFFTGSPWPSDSQLVAEAPCRVVEMPGEDFEVLLREETDFTIPLVKNLVRKIIRLDRNVLQNKLKRGALQTMISMEQHVFPDYHMGDYVRRRISGSAEELVQSEGPILVCGESGVGKEGTAHYVFRKSTYGKSVFLFLDLLATRDGDDADSEIGSNLGNEAKLTDRQLRLLFGFEEPGRDGGVKETPGYFEMSEDGTLLIRGIEQLTPVVQVKLLEAILTDTFRRTGGSHLKKAKVRVIATTRVEPGHISPERHPLIYALAQRSMTIPPLRTRRREIPGLIKHYLAKYSQELRREQVKLPNDTLKTLVNYTWPGNDLELATTLKRAILVSPDGVLRPQDIYFDLKRIQGSRKLDLLRLSAVKGTLKSPLYPAILQSAATPFFFIILAFLFLGPSDPLRNPAALISWALGWPIMIVGAFFSARFWCSVCPIGTIGNLAKKIVSLEKPFPAFLKNHSDFLIAGAVLFIIWFETATGIRNSPFNLGLLLLTMLVSAIVAAVVFERQSWCLYLCGLGGMVGVLAKTSWVELRANRNVCISQCTSNECYLGTADNEGCPFGHAGPRLQSNRVCKLCATCVKNCPHDAIHLNFRIPGREIWEIRQPRAGTSFLVVGMIGGLLSEMVSQMPIYKTVTSFMPFPPIIRFSVVFIALLLGLNLMLMLASFSSSRIFRNSFVENYARYGEALLPLTLCSYMAFHLYYFFTLGVQLPILATHNFDLAIFQKLVIQVPSHLVQGVQSVLIWLGLGWCLAVIYRAGRANRDDPLMATAGLAVHGIVAIVIAVFLQEAMASFFSAVH